MKLVRVSNIEFKEYSGNTHDIEVGGANGSHSYVVRSNKANGLVVHNSVCTTRKMTGIGYPQLSAVIECADAAHGLRGHIIADGGCSVPGDIVKAFAAGADFVMLGSMLAGHKEGLPPGYKDTVEGQSLVDFYGMSSKSAMDLHNGGVASYRASEGKHVKIPYRGEVSRTMQDILGGLRSACTYVGAAELKELSKRTTFVRVTQQLNESLSSYEI